MALANPELSHSDSPPLCDHCGDVIGVYEPLVHVVGGNAWMTSRAAQPALSAGSPGTIYHVVCHALAAAGATP